MGEVSVFAAPAQLDLATALADLADRPAEWPGLGRRAVGPLRLIVVADRAALAAVTRGRAPRWGAGIALPAGRIIILRADLPDLAATLRHELAHIVLHQAIHTRVPLWFDEGYATLASGEWDFTGRLELHLAVAFTGVPSLGDLDGQLRGTEPTAERAYVLAAAGVLGLERRIPGGELSPLMAALASGVPFDSAVQQVTGRTLSQFEYEWRQETRRRYGGVAWLAGTGLWMILTIAVVVGWGWRRRMDVPRREALNEGWPDPEAPEPPLDPGPPPV
ncbi:MAG: peptidase MA family metallohydrolase [Gemmatimonadales bacterium]